MFKVNPLVFSLLAFTASARRLDFEKLGLGYEPLSAVTDHAAIDLDQASMEVALAIGTADSFENAKSIYQEGGHSKSFATVTLAEGLTSEVPKGTPITGRSEAGNPVAGVAFSGFEVGDTEISIQYATSDVQASYVNCKVGALRYVGEEVTVGCFAPEGEISIEGVGDHSYTYDVLEDNNNGRSLAGFSTGARGRMYEGCPGCPYPDFLKFYNYYGVIEYAHEWVMAAFDARSTNFTNGNADFSGSYSFTQRTEAVKKGTAYMNVWMYVIREFYDAIDDCESGCMDCNDDPVSAWDEGVAFFVGSTESLMPYTLGQKRCENYMTCGQEGNELQGTAKVNYDLMQLMTEGQTLLRQGECDAALRNAELISQKMAIPLTQGAMRYAYKVEYLQGDDKEKAEGSVFAAAVLPILHDCDADAAQVVYDNVRVGAPTTDYLAVRGAFESQYECMGLTCEDIGGLFNAGTNEYYTDAAPCGSGVTETDADNMEDATREEQENDSAAASSTHFFALVAVAVLALNTGW